MLRLTSKKDYTRLRQSNLKVIGKFFIIVYIPDNEITEPAAGITVSKKIGNAVKRNKVKRRIKAFLCSYLMRPSVPGFICNIIALAPVVLADWLSFKRDLQYCLDKLTEKVCLQSEKSQLV